MGRVFCIVVFVWGGCGGAGGQRCRVDGECPSFQLCAESGACVSGCLSASDCGAGELCSPHGRCVSSDEPDLASSSDLGGPASAPDLATASDLASAPDLARDLASRDLTAPPDLTQVDAWICTGVCPDAAREPGNNTSAGASALGDAATISDGAICPTNDVDWFAVTASRRETLRVVLTEGPCGGALQLTLYAADGTTVLASGNDVSVSLMKNAKVYARVSGAQNLYVLTTSN